MTALNDDPAHKANHFAALRKAERAGRESPGTAERLEAEAAERDRKLNQRGKSK